MSKFGDLMTVASFGGYVDPEDMLYGLNRLMDEDLVVRNRFTIDCGLTVLVMRAEYHPYYGQMLVLGFEQEVEPVEFPHRYVEGNEGSDEPHTWGVFWNSKVTRRKFDEMNPVPLRDW